MERFTQASQLLFGEIDIDVLRFERSKNTNYENGKSPAHYRTIAINEALYEKFDLVRTIDKYPFVPEDEVRCSANCKEVIAMQTAGLAKRWRHTAAKSVVVGISGGLDSTLALLICINTADLLGYNRNRIIAVTMPCFGTTTHTRTNAERLAKSLGVTFREIDIKTACLQHFKDIGHNPDVHNTVFENTQARERTQVLMDIANAENGLVIGTGDMSELALGWATYNGDLASMYGVNAGVPKTLISYLIAHIALKFSEEQIYILQSILATPISPELLPAGNADTIIQKTEDIVGPYELHDFFLFYLVRFGIAPKKILFLAQQAFADMYDASVISKWLNVFLQRFFAQQYKRSCLPDSPKIGTVCLSRELHLPSDGVGFALEG
jgi:NAD+ synthase (glutamine-hydrolysing)